MYTLKLLLILLVLLAVSHIGYTAKILAVTFVATKSHKMAAMPLLEELGKRGHEITILSPFHPFSDKPSKNVKEILTIDVEKKSENFFGNPYKIKEENRQYNPLMNTKWFTAVCGETYDLPHVKALLNETFDLIFIQPLANDCALGFVNKMGVPYVLYSPIAVPNFLAERFGAYFPPSFVPNILSGLTSDMSFPQRLKNAAYELLLRGTIKIVYEPASQAVYRQKLGEEIPSIPEILSNASLILSNGHFSVDSPRPLLPDIVDVGGLNERPAEPVPKDIEDFIKKGKDGFIYFSLGSALKGSNMPEEKRKLFFNVFAKLKHQVLWKWETEKMSNLPSNVMLSKWFPQQDLLGHKDIKIFITHCGGGSTEEAIYHGVPVIGLPMFADQPQNANLAKNLGFSLNLDWNLLTEENLLEAINEMLKNSSYKENVQRISAIFKDRPVKPMDNAVYWIEYVLRHNGANHLRAAGRNLGFFQYHFLDVILTYVGACCLILYLIVVLIRGAFRICFGFFTGKNKKD